MPYKFAAAVMNARIKRKGYKSRITRVTSKRPKRALRRRTISLNVHRFSRWSDALSNITVSGTSISGAMQFTMDQVINYGEFSSLFDQFRITRVVCQFQLITNPDASWATNNPAGNHNQSNWFPKMWWMIDHDGGTADSLSEIKERQGVKCKVLRPNQILRISIPYPKVAVQTYRTATATGYGPKNMFLDFANGYDVPHYGLHYVVDALGVDPNDAYPFLIRRELKFYFTCKDVR